MMMQEKEEVEQEDDNDIAICVICLEGFTASDVVRELPVCHHIFHRRCIDLWLRGKKMDDYYLDL